MQTALKMSSAHSAFRGTTIPPRPTILRAQRLRATSVITAETTERLRLNNLSPAKGSRRQEKRKGRGHSAGQGATCGFGNRGQKSRANGGPRPGFEGGQTPLYRRVPKLKGIAGGMGAGLPDFVTVNLSDLAKAFQAGQEVSLDILKDKGLLNPSGREARLPLKVLGAGELPFALNIKAASFSSSATEKIQAAGGSVEVLPAKTTWTKAGHKAMVEALAANGQDYKKVAAEKKAARAEAKLAKRKADAIARKEAKLA